MKKTMNLIVAAMVFCSFAFATPLTAQEWSKDQMAVWKSVEDGWAVWKSGDFDAMFNGIHEKYMGWNNQDPLPISKEKWSQMYEMWKDYIIIEYYDIQPARILVEGDNAVVYYFFNFSSVYSKGDKKKENSVEGRNVEFYVKKGGEWMLLGDMTYFEEDDD